MILITTPYICKFKPLDLMPPRRLIKFMFDLSSLSRNAFIRPEKISHGEIG